MSAAYFTHTHTIIKHRVPELPSPRATRSAANWARLGWLQIASQRHPSSPKTSPKTLLVSNVSLRLGWLRVALITFKFV